MTLQGPHGVVRLRIDVENRMCTAGGSNSFEARKFFISIEIAEGCRFRGQRRGGVVSMGAMMPRHRPARSLPRSDLVGC